MTSSSGAALVKKGHPIRGVLWGIMFGLGLAGVLVVTKVIPLDLTQMIVVLALGIAVGVLWSLFGPARAPKGAAPVAAAGVAVDETPEAAVDEIEVSETEREGDPIDLSEQDDGFDTEAEATESGSDSTDDGDSTANDEGWRSNS